ncbi:hypothetical protein V9L05_13205 [Bernardetia sp. Wsw4-3y2]|uniref:hypothetical protein n=1 Tax=unclassified Bernardetia TaxID=2647129 RepID=UPI0030D5CA38
MIFIATEDQKGKITAFFSKNKKQLKEKGFKWIRKFDDEHRAILWVNESYLLNQKEFLY